MSSLQLFFSPGSPYACKVMAVAHALGVADRITCIPGSASPVKRNPAIGSHNPSGMVPTLLTASDGPIFDSRVICDYLAAMVPGQAVIPAEGGARWRALREQAIADGMLDAALLLRYETGLRPQALRWDAWAEGQATKVRHALDSVEAQALNFGERAEVGTLAIACALRYLDERLPELRWREARPQLTLWYDRFFQGPSLKYVEWLASDCATSRSSSP